MAELCLIAHSKTMKAQQLIFKDEDLQFQLTAKLVRSGCSLTLLQQPDVINTSFTMAVKVIIIVDTWNCAFGNAAKTYSDLLPRPVQSFTKF